MKNNNITSAVGVYQLIHSYLENEKDSKRTNAILFANLSRFRTLVSWELTRDNLCRLKNFRTIGTNPDWQKTAMDFFRAAFRDLSPLRDPGAMALFNELEKSSWGNTLYLCTRNVKHRQDGSAFMILHVSNFQRFKVFFEEITEETLHRGNLQEGMMVW